MEEPRRDASNDGEANRRINWTSVSETVHCKFGGSLAVLAMARSPSSALLPFFWEGSPTKVDYRKRVPLF